MDLKKLTVVELKHILKSEGIRGVSNLRKAELIWNINVYVDNVENVIDKMADELDEIRESNKKRTKEYRDGYKEETSEYAKAYKEANKEKTKAYQSEYYQKNKEKRRRYKNEYMKKYYAKNKDDINSKAKEKRSKMREGKANLPELKYVAENIYGIKNVSRLGKSALIDMIEKKRVRRMNIFKETLGEVVKREKEMFADSKRKLTDRIETLAKLDGITDICIDERVNELSKPQQESVMRALRVDIDYKDIFVKYKKADYILEVSVVDTELGINMSSKWDIMSYRGLDEDEFRELKEENRY